MAISNLDVKKLREVLIPMYHAPEMDTFDYQARFIEDVNLSLNVFEKRFSIETLAGKFVNLLKKGFNSAVNPDERYKIIQGIFSKEKEYNSVKEQLAPLKAEIVFHSKKYLEGKTAITKNKTNKNRF